MIQHKVMAIVVTYFPDSEIISKTIESIYRQVSQLFIIDNTPNGSEMLKNFQLLKENSNIHLVTLGRNTGIAHAQNVGIKKAMEEKADFILLSDQDTVYPENYIKDMLKAYNSLADKDKIAVIVPDFAELNRGGTRQGFVRFYGLFSKRLYPQTGCYEISQAIASGMIIPEKVFDNIGFMDEELFIDWVDLEWCWRARAKGYKIIGNANVIVVHRLGDKVTKVGTKSYSIRSPIRDYYIVRNAVYLALRSKYLTLGMRLNLLVKVFKYIIGFTILGKPHEKHFVYSVKGFYHGILGIMGAYR